MKRVLAVALLAVSASAALATEPTPSPRQCFSSFLKSVYYAKDLSPVLAYFPREKQTEWNKLSPSDKYAKLRELKSYYIGNARYRVETIDGNKAHVEAIGVGSSNGKTYNAGVNIDLLREQGYWKLDRVDIHQAS